MSAGPTCLPHGPGLVAAAVQLSDVGFFWEAPRNSMFPVVPWAVTANMMIRNTDARYPSHDDCCRSCVRMRPPETLHNVLTATNALIPILPQTAQPTKWAVIA